jgi:class 3 adenylate cyclase
MVFDQFERALRRAMAVRSWGPESGTSPFGAVDAVTAGANAEHVALGFVDLVGSTAWAQGLNLRDQSLALARFESAAWESAVLSGGRIVKMIGDEVFFAAPTADAACRIGIDAIRAAAEDEVLPPARGVVGLGYATPREGDYFGPLVNLLSRMVKIGNPNDLIVTEEVAKELTPNDWSIEPLEPIELRGIEEPVRAFHVERLRSLT